MKTMQLEFRSYDAANNALEFFRNEINFDVDSPVRSWNYNDKNQMSLLLPFICFSGDTDFLILVTEKMQLYFAEYLL